MLSVLTKDEDVDGLASARKSAVPDAAFLVGRAAGGAQERGGERLARRIELGITSNTGSIEEENGVSLEALGTMNGHDGEFEPKAASVREGSAVVRPAAGGAKACRVLAHDLARHTVQKAGEGGGTPAPAVQNPGDLVSEIAAQVTNVDMASAKDENGPRTAIQPQQREETAE